ncbi:hypothetical protein [Geomonas anaerohicana]|uniref:Uncharacterized protein n=1 Tax=Geomonas anaerohicana TaxID=2798583 RepID=A0ABS0YC87_9BACT|nr:hypothetical protein [Geomonas anaerohicana]MBJ6749895.1 hypothetical protein [Geomonas anaerohicana]
MFKPKIITVEENEDIFARIATMNAKQCCEYMCHQGGIYIKYIAPRLLQLCDSDRSRALALFHNSLNEHYGFFCVNALNTRKGQPMHEPQKLYNRLVSRYR